MFKERLELFQISDTFLGIYRCLYKFFFNFSNFFLGFAAIFFRLDHCTGYF